MDFECLVEKLYRNISLPAPIFFKKAQEILSFNSFTAAKG